MADNPRNPSEPKLVETKQIVEKNLKEQLKDIKEFKEKPEKIEQKEIKDIKDKPEKFEHKEKPEKHEFKEKEFFKEKEIKVEQLEKQQVVEQNPKDIAEGPLDGNPGGPVEQRLTALEQSVASLNHFITTGQRPDLSRGALAAERDTKK